MVIVGQALLLTVSNPAIRYLACFLVIMGIYLAKIDMMWLTDNVSGHYKRATMVGVTIAIGNSSGLITGQIFTTQDQPRYIKGLSVTIGELS